jgi:hypothetical protein
LLLLLIVQLGKNNSKSGAWRPRDVAAAADCKTTLLLPARGQPLGAAINAHSLSPPDSLAIPPIQTKNPQQYQQQPNPEPKTQEEEHHCSRFTINQKP